MEFTKLDIFRKGVEAVKRYIDFCWDNYTYADDEFFARTEFINDLVYFVKGEKDYIPNRRGKTFEEFCLENKV